MSRLEALHLQRNPLSRQVSANKTARVNDVAPLPEDDEDESPTLPAVRTRNKDLEIPHSVTHDEEEYDYELNIDTHAPTGKHSAVLSPIQQRTGGIVSRKSNDAHARLPTLDSIADADDSYRPETSVPLSDAGSIDHYEDHDQATG